ncbi:MAG: TolC family protein [Sorangiineae bacterium]|nr:TolC family protein [Polyangiaceae bacterium]MEB2321966.1 TolC family protein [Sorangiineae bacterium]
MRVKLPALLLAALVFGWPGLGVAEPAPEGQAARPGAPGAPAVAVRPRSEYTLARCLALAEQNYPKIHAARARLDYKRAQQFEARTAPFSEFSITGGVGLAPTVRGTNVYSPNTDVALTSNMALAWQVGIDGTVPLWTFGKISNLWDAASAQVAVGEHEVKKEANAVKLSVRQAFYGIQLARDTRILLRDAAERIDKYLGRLEKKVEEGDGDDIELLKLKMYRAEIDARDSEVTRQEAIALAGLRFLTGVRGAFDIPDVPLRRNPHALAPLARYLQAARLFRPEINMARAGVVARQAQVEMERARYYPDLALGLNARWARAPEVTDQTNPYVLDSGNYLRYGAALVMRWKLDFLPQSARLAQAQAQLEETRATERYALGGVAVEVEQAFAEAEDAARRLDAYTRATGYARQWLIKVQQGIDVGTFEDEDIVDPAKEYALKRFAQMSATYDYDLAIAKLALATGWDSIATP